MQEFSEQRLRELRGLATKLFCSYMADRLGLRVATVERQLLKGKYGDVERLGGEWYLFAEAIQAEQGVAMGVASGADPQRIANFCACLNDLIATLQQAGERGKEQPPLEPPWLT